MSGGPAATRGFLIQTITCILKALKEKNWDMVEIEPTDSNEKIDLKWYVGNELELATQVKSSINPFLIETVIKLLSQMIGSCPEAKVFELVLVGNFEEGMIKFSRQIEEELEFSSAEKEKIGVLMQYIKEKRIHITLHNFNRIIDNKTPILIQMKDEIHEHLPPEIKLTHKELSTLSLALIGQFSIFATASKTVTNSELNMLIRTMIKDKLEEIRINNYKDYITVNVENFTSEIDKAMESDVVKQWHDQEFQTRLKFLIAEIAFNAFEYGKATYSYFQIYPDRIILKDDGIKFDFSKDIGEIKSTGYRLGKETFIKFFDDYHYVTKYNHNYDKENNINTITIHIITDFNIFVENNCEVITKGTFNPISRNAYKKSISLSIPSNCNTFVYNSKHLFATGEATLIELILSKIPLEGNLIIKYDKNYPSIDGIKTLFKDEKRLTFETIQKEEK
ncbi:hypothetical protein COE58_10435 [Bacillus cereus]|uniref:hypothetical protein n=1 Tax=Bacillus cereus TaxID=1396 RepID=UPI0001A03953|nr:hypothetical protein [Bacillus cereus]EEK80113.1 hypothetical protein bcere0009_11200 [Bacillus cereus R309803]PGZ62150.1 hypothetical protein COE58_10435 [Bacillus cereus]HDR4560394.1 hypothetical protein [Bacillus luti]